MFPTAAAAALRVRRYRCRRWACAIPAASFERLQVRECVGQLLRGEKLIGHEIARLDVLRILNPARQIPGIVEERAGGQRAPAHEMREVGRADGARPGCRGLGGTSRSGTRSSDKPRVCSGVAGAAAGSSLQRRPSGRSLPAAPRPPRIACARAGSRKTPCIGRDSGPACPPAIQLMLV